MIWQVKEKVGPDFIASFPELNEITLQLLFNRGLITKKEIDNFLDSSYEDLLDPYLFKDMEQAVDRFIKAISEHQKIMVYGDYDADGVCSTSALYLTIKALGGDVDTYIPFREGEGYGLNKKVVQSIIDQKFDLVMTVDCGVSNVEEIKELKEAGIDTIVLDHHQEPLELPPALAIIDPSVKSGGYPFTYLCGAGVVFKFVSALIIWLEKNDFPLRLPVGFEKWLLDIVAIATVGDIVPLIGENRIIVKYGLKVIEKTRNYGLKKLIESINFKSFTYDSEYLGWRIVPRLNAAGRINHASASFYLLTAKDEAEAEKYVAMLEESNKSRQQITEKLMAKAELEISKTDEADKILIITGDGWPAGVLGLVAGRMSDRHYKPVLVFSYEQGRYVASGRSIPEFDITSALKKCDQFLLKYGGHPQACGLTIEGEANFNNFKAEISCLAKDELDGVELIPKLEIEAEIRLDQVNWTLYDDLVKFEPFGEKNEKPLFAMRQLVVEQIQSCGADGKHLRVMVSQNGDLNNLHKIIGFSFGEWCAKLKSGDMIDIVFELGVNEWNGNRELQLKLVDLKLSE
jgi:single-stranded-DNA-specific exonuclease